MEFEKLKNILAEVFDIEIPAEATENITTVEEAVEMIKKAVNQ